MFLSGPCLLTQCVLALSSVQALYPRSYDTVPACLGGLSQHCAKQNPAKAHRSRLVALCLMSVDTKDLVKLQLAC